MRASLAGTLELNLHDFILGIRNKFHVTAIPLQKGLIVSIAAFSFSSICFSFLSLMSFLILPIRDEL